MRLRKTYLNCDRDIPQRPHIAEIEACVGAIVAPLPMQHDYNEAFAIEFRNRGWESQPQIFGNLKADFRKNDVVVEVQFGNSATLFRDLYKFHYAYNNGLLSLAVLIVPVNPRAFFRHRVASVSNMAEFDFAERHFKLLALSVPILLIGLLPPTPEERK